MFWLGRPTCGQELEKSGQLHEMWLAQLVIPLEAQRFPGHGLWHNMTRVKEMAVCVSLLSSILGVTYTLCHFPFQRVLGEKVLYIPGVEFPNKCKLQPPQAAMGTSQG